MPSHSDFRGVIILGPTAIGKTGLAMRLQDQLGGPSKAQIISVDSAMIYRGMDIGTAKPTAAELTNYPHKLIDLRDPVEPYSVADFVRDADAEVNRCKASAKVPILVGGTMLYIARFLRGITQLPSADQTMRDQLREELASVGASTLYAELQQRDAVAAELIHPNNHQRLLRALEVLRITGSSLSEQWEEQVAATSHDRLGYDFTTFGLVPNERSQLHTVIERRFEMMIEAGFVSEVEKLFLRGDLTPDLPSMRAVGYRQAWRYLEGEYDATVFRSKAIAATRQLAKRQLTWMRQWPGLETYADNQFDNALNDSITNLDR